MNANTITVGTKINPDPIGICPYPDQSLYSTYVAALQFNLNGTSCHTYDRFNWNAQKDCGIGSSAATNATWATLVDSSFNITYWPYI